jgi:serine/threonine protein kinase
MEVTFPAMIEGMAVPRYREESLLGMGGMAEVWRAVGPEGPVAVKRLLPHAARNPSLAAAFEREGRLLSRIDHPNVIGIREIARDERGTCLVLEYVEGSDLAAISGPLPSRIALRIIRDLLRALEAVHGLCDEEGRSLGLIHRDLSPGNVLVGLDGSVKLTDFGIARAASGTHAKTTGQSIKGTLAYLSPEQARGAPVDARADLFAAGALLYEMLAGVPIYNEDDPRLALAMARAGDVRSLASVKPDTPAAIVELVDRSLAASPADRFSNAATMRGELERVASVTAGLADDGELTAWVRSFVLVAPRARPPNEAAPTAVVRRTASWRKTVAAASAAALLLLIASWFVISRSNESAGSPSSAVALDDLAAPAAETPTPPGEALGPAESAGTPSMSGTAGRAAAAKSAGAGDRRLRQPAPAPGNASSAPVSPRARDHRAGRSQDPSQKCLLDIGSEPAFAYVSIDGVMVGPTPLFDREVGPGTHRIQVARDGLGSKSFVVEVRPGDRIRRVVKFP